MTSWVLVTHTCNPSSEIRRIRIQSQPQAKRSRDPTSKKPIIKRAAGVAQGVDPECSSPRTTKKKKNQRERERDP
jgi:hypothetical protein